MDNEIKKIVLQYKRGIRTEREAWQGIMDVYIDAGFPCTLGTAEQVLNYFITIV